MAFDEAIQGLRNLISEKTQLNEVAADKIQKLTAQLQDAEESSEPIHDPIDKIRRGFINFRVNQFDRYPWYYDQLKHDQKPYFLVFACSDSRVSPTFILNFLPGEAFMARNIANLVPPFDEDKGSGVGAIIEYAVTQLKVNTILVVGHTKCGGIKRLMTMEDDPDTQFDFVDEWVKIATPAKEAVNESFGYESIEDRCARCEKEAVKLSLKYLESYPYLKQQKVRLLGGYYDFINGQFLVWWPEGDYSHPIVVPGPSPPSMD